MVGWYDACHFWTLAGNGLIKKPLMPKIRLKKQKGQFDKLLFWLTIVLTLLGLVAVADASAPQALTNFSDKYYFVKQQLVWAFVGLVFFAISSKINYQFWRKIGTPIFFISVLFLIAVLIPGVGLKTLGARRWISLGFFVFQPSELIKFTLVLYFAKLSVNGKKIITYLIPLAIVAGLIMLEPDLGTTIVVVSTGLIQMFIAGINIFAIIGASLAGGLASLLLIFTSEYRKARLLTFLTNSQDPLGKGYHIRQVLFALGLGGVFGSGLGASKQKYLFLPEAATDSIFAVIAEEIGFIGASALILLFAVFVIRMFMISSLAPDTFSKTLGFGISAWIAIQIIMNLGSMLALMPLTGIPLPLFSYGGSSLVMILFAVGIILNISKFTYAKKR